MPFTPTPTSDTYSQENISLTREISSRQNDLLSTKDEMFVNSISEIVKNKQFGENRTFHMKRAGASAYLSGIGEVRGTFFWGDAGLFVYSVGANVYLYNVTTLATTTCTSVFSTSTGLVGFTLFMYEDSSVRLVVTDGTTLATIDSSGVVTPSTDPQLPTPHVPCPVFLDGYLFLVKTDTADLYNSDLDDPLAFSPDNYISTEIEADDAQWVGKLNNYLVVFGSKTVEYFYDAAVETGSPLARNDIPVKLTGYVGGAVNYGNSIVFLGYNENMVLDVFKLQDFTIETCSSDAVRRFFATSTDPVTSYKGNIVTNLGHTFYVVSGGVRTYVYDLNEKLWGTWRWQSGNVFNITTATVVKTATGLYTMFTIAGDSNIYRFNSQVYQDAGVNFTWSIVTEANDFGTMHRKTMSRLAVVCDRPASTSNLSVSVSDDDFKSWYGGWLINLDQDLPSTHKLGSFRQRAFKLEYTDNFPLRVQYLQALINKGRN